MYPIYFLGESPLNFPLLRSHGRASSDGPRLLKALLSDRAHPCSGSAASSRHWESSRYGMEKNGAPK